MRLQARPDRKIHAASPRMHKLPRVPRRTLSSFGGIRSSGSYISRRRNVHRPIIIRLLAEELIARRGTFKRHSDRDVKHIRNERDVQLETREIIDYRNQSPMSRVHRGSAESIFPATKRNDR